MTYPCPIQYCDHGRIAFYGKCRRCKGTGQVADRRQSQRRQGEGRRRYDGAEP